MWVSPNKLRANKLRSHLSHLVVEGHVVWYIRPCCLMRDNIYCRLIRRGVYAMHHTYYIDSSLSHHHHCHSYILVISHSYISLLMSLACHNSVIIYKTLYSPCHFYDVYSPTHIIYSMLLCENREGVHEGVRQMKKTKRFF